MRSADRPKVLVLLAAHNGTSYLVEQVESILGQEQVDVEVLVSVDRSTDGTEALVDDLAQREPRLSALPHGQRFGGAAPNFYRLMAEARTDGFTHVALADQDDVWFANKLARATAAMQEKEAVAYSSNVLRWSAEKRTLVAKAQPQTEWDHLFSSAGPGCTYVFDGPVFARFAQWLVDHREMSALVDYHDWLLYAWMRQHGYPWFIDPWPSMLYRQHDANQLGANAGVRAAARRLAALAQSWYFTQVIHVAKCVDATETGPVATIMSGSPGRLALLALRGRNLRRSWRDAAALRLALAAKAVTGVFKP